MILQTQAIDLRCNLCCVPPPSHPHVGNRETSTEQEKRVEKLLRSCRAARDVFRSKKKIDTQKHTQAFIG